MASSDEDIEQSISSRTATPIAQLGPDLSEQAARKVHGEITITWPYSTVSKTFAFLLAEPDFRLRRNKGQVRIQLKGPSAEAIGNWELGSGDEVTLALDGAEWAKDDESARPAGSRSEWQLKFAGKLTLKATLGETQETKFVHIDQPVPIEVPEAPHPIPFAEIDLTIFDALPALEKPPSPSAPPAPPRDDDYASPMFMKRSRASYGPLFELDLDDELEDDGGRKGKGRKRPRYSALNGVWRLNEENSSPEPDQLEGTPLATQEQNEDVEMHDTPDRSAMADGGVQTNESDLDPVPSSPITIPSKTWSGAGASLSSHSRLPRPHDASRTDSGVQASPSRPTNLAQAERHEMASTQAAPSPFGQASQSSGVATFGLPQELSQDQRNAPSLFGTAPIAASNHGFGGASSPFGTALNTTANQGLGQTSSLFGMISAPAQPSFAQSGNADSGFSVTSGSVRFGFGQEPQSTFGTSPFGITHASAHRLADPYPESSLDQQESPNYLSNASHNAFSAGIGNPVPEYGFEAPLEQAAPKDRTSEQDVAPWPMSTQKFLAMGTMNASENLGSDGSDPEGTPPGMVPPAVEDGTRNVDEMRQEGILSQPVYRQGVPQEALADREDASAGEEGDSMDSDEQAAYDDAEKGDDYDLRNYDRVSDDEEGFEDEEPLSDDELLDEGPEHWAREDAGDDEEDYDEEEEDYMEQHNNYSQPSRPFSQPQFPPQPTAQKDKIVIDLLSDSDDDEPPAAPPFKVALGQIPLHGSASLPESHPADFSETESIDQHDDRVARTGPAFQPFDLAKQDSRTGREGVDFDEETGNLEDEDDNYAEEEHFQDNEDEPELDSELAESDDEEDAEAREAILVDRANEPYLQTNSFNGAMDVDDDLQDSQTDQDDDEAEIKESTPVNGLSGTDQLPDSDSRNIVKAGDDDQCENQGESLRTHPDEMVASFKFQPPGSPSLSRSSESHETKNVVMEDGNGQEATNTVDTGEPQQSASESDRSDNLGKEVSEQQLRTDAEPADLGSEEVMEAAAAEVTTVGNQETQEVDESSSQQDKSSISPEMQHQEGLASSAPAVETSETTITSHEEIQLSHQQVVFETEEIELKSQLVLSQSTDKKVAIEGEADHESAVEERDVEMVDAGVAAEKEGGMEQAGTSQLPLEQDNEQSDEVQDVTPSDILRDPSREEMGSVSASQVTADVPPNQAADEKQRILDHIQHSYADNDDESYEAAEMNEQARESSVVGLEDSFASVDSEVSGLHDAEESETAPAEKRKRGGKKTRMSSSSKSAKSTPASQKAQRQSSRQASRQASAPQAPSSRRTTRSKTMGIQAASPKEDKEDMSIRLARAALKSPTSKKKKGSANAAKHLNTDLVRRLDTDLPDCVSLNDLRKYNANFVDVAVVATSANVPPKRTPTREYASSFTVTDPSFTPDGVVEVDLYSLHKEHLPVVKTGDSVVLRGFLVVSLPDRGFGLKTKDGSSWAVFKAEGDDQPEMKAAIVEMSDKETTFMLDLRAWYAGLDDTVKGKLAIAVGEMVETGKESRAKK